MQTASPAGSEAGYPDSHLRALRVLVDRLPLDRVDWALTGSMGHALQGVPVAVHDIDVQTDLAGAGEAARRLTEFVATAPYLRTSDRMQSVFGVLRVHGVTVEVMGCVRKRRDVHADWEEAVDPADFRRVLVVDGLAVPVLTLAYEARAYDLIGRPDRAELLRRYATAWG